MVKCAQTGETQLQGRAAACSSLWGVRAVEQLRTGPGCRRVGVAQPSHMEHTLFLCRAF